MPSDAAAARALARSRDAMATTREWAVDWIAGITLVTAMLAAPRMPQRTGAGSVMRGFSIAGIGKVWRWTGGPVDRWTAGDSERQPSFMEIGLYSFVEIPRDPATGLAAVGAQR